MAFNFQRPNLPYEGESLQNDKRYQLLEAQGKPPTAQMFDADFNCLTDNDRKLDEALAGVAAGIIPGASIPGNANKLPVTNGEDPATISWVLISDQYVEDESLSASKLLPGTLTALQMMDGTITAPKLAPNCVTTIKILDFNVTANKLAPDAVTTIKILDENVTTPKIADEAITAAKMADDAVTTPKILDGAVTLPKVNAVFPVTMGGSGLSTLTTSNGVICAGTTPTGNFQNAGVGSLNQIFMGNGGSAVGSWKNLNTLAATKADQIAANSTEVYTNPSTQQHHPSACKAWATFNTTGTQTLQASYNVLSITDIGDGKTTVTLITNFASAEYSIVSGVNRDNTASTIGEPTVVWNQAAGSFNIGTSNGVFVDVTRVFVACFGVQ